MRRIEALRQGWTPNEEKIRPPLSDENVAWRLSVHTIAAQGVPHTSGEHGVEWSGLFLRFTAVWSHESRNTHRMPPGSHDITWDDGKLTLALPNSKGAPVAEIRVQLCAKAPGHPDEVLGSGTTTLAEREGEVSRLALLGAAWLSKTAAVSFSFMVDGMTRLQADDEWDAEAAAEPSALDADADGAGVPSLAFSNAQPRVGAPSGR